MLKLVDHSDTGREAGHALVLPHRRRCPIWLLVLVMQVTIFAHGRAQSLEEQLREIPAAELASQARNQGDPVRGAIVFHQPQNACSKCHPTSASPALFPGPNLAALPRDLADDLLVESVLWPSKVIRRGYESVTLVTGEGKSLTGLVTRKTSEEIELRDLTSGRVQTFQVSSLDSMTQNETSLMPTGQVNLLTSRQQFLDLVRYLIELRDGGEAKARELQPSASLLTLSIPEYEQRIDHAGFIRDWNDESLKRGEAIYRRVCMNCHGTREQVGSLPTSLRFADGKFRNGSHPLAIYQTLTRGFGLMAAQTWMVPSQKYDVIHYLREAYLRRYNQSQFSEVDEHYLADLPKGTERGPEPSQIQPWSSMDYGPTLTHTYEIPGSVHNFAYKGIAIRLDPGAGGVARGRHWMIFDTDTLRMAAVWHAADPGQQGSRSTPPTKTGDQNHFIDWRGIQFNGEHQIHPRIVGQLVASVGTGPGWADPATASFDDDQRIEGRDGRRYGPLPRSWGRFHGLYHSGQQVILSYSVGETKILENPRMLVSDEAHPNPVFLRTFDIGSRPEAVTLRLTNIDSGGDPAGAGVSQSNQNPAVISVSSANGRLTAGFLPERQTLKWTVQDNHLLLTLPAGPEPLRFTVWFRHADASTATDGGPPAIVPAESDLSLLTHGGPPRWTQKLTTTVVKGVDDGPFGVDILTTPDNNPWLAQTRLTGLDFFDDGRMAVCSWDGDVWLVDGFLQGDQLTWRRIASGLFQPLGLRIVNGRIHLTCRDQLAVLHDLNGDAEVDYIECLNNDHQVTEHFHEFAMGLQTDSAGNFYYAKSGRHALKAVVPHHGTLLKVSRDGSKTEILATGFRAANGVCLNPDGSFVVTDQEGFWNPKNRINWVTVDPGGPPKFYGNMFGYHNVKSSSDDAMEPPLCWITNAFDRSPGELVWVNSDAWGPLKGSLLNLSYGYGRVYLVPHESVSVPGRGKVHQGGMIRLPIPDFPTGVMRGRFHPTDGQLYLCGMFAWAGSATSPGGLYRLRATGRPVCLPTQLRADSTGLHLTFPEILDPGSVEPKNIQVKTWALKRSERYGSDHYDEQPLPVQAVRLSADRHTLTIAAPLQPVWCMEIRYTLKSEDGEPVEGIIHNTIHSVTAAN